MSTKKQAPPPAAPTPMDLLHLAITKGASGDDIDKYIALVDRQRSVDAEQAFTRAMIDLKQNDLPQIYRNAGAAKFVDGQDVEWDYATLDRVCDHLIPALAKHGIIHSWDPAQPGDGPDANMVCITAVLHHELGHSRRATLKAPADPSGGKTPVQAIQSTTTSLERYTLLAVCGIAVKQQRDDGGGGVQAGARKGNAKPADVAAAKNGSAAQQGPSPQLLKNARGAADKGDAVFAQFWKEVTPDQRRSLFSEMPDLERRTKDFRGT